MNRPEPMSFFSRKSVGGGVTNAACNTFIIFIETYIICVMRYSIQARKQSSAGHPPNLWLIINIWATILQLLITPTQAYTHTYYYVLFLYTLSCWPYVRALKNEHKLKFIDICELQRQWSGVTKHCQNVTYQLIKTCMTNFVNQKLMSL